MLWPAVTEADLIELVTEFNDKKYKICLNNKGYAGFVFFDIGSVLLDLDWDISFKACEKIFPVGSKINHYNVLDILRANHVLSDWCTGQMGAFSYAQALMNAYRQDANISIEKSPLSILDLKHADSLVVGALRSKVYELAKKLRDMNFAIGVLSNATTWHEVMIEKRLPVRDFFDVCIFSQDLGCEKPQKKIYEIAQYEANRFVQKKFNATLDPNDIYFIDDTPANVRAAREMNWQASLVNLFNNSILEKISQKKITEKELKDASHKRENLLFGQNAAVRVENLFKSIVSL
ncbi:HAD family hydrolase [Fluviispira vulneris]|uniref:HAD family hydrolase n=1 Tax=Fluviispira vulneris TaxID=2763012 RepID=UPI001644B60A|nr:HAD family hydrolase [Fluviispira vulneris]